MCINFFYEDTPFQLKQTQQVSNWIKKVISLEAQILEELNYIFCSDNYLHEINKTYLGHDTYTDIITFDYKEKNGAPIEGEVCISVDRVQENATTYQKTFEEELHRVIIHGVLHLLGYRDKTPQEQKEMRKKEEACLSLQNIS